MLAWCHTVMPRAARMGLAHHSAAGDAGKIVAADWSKHWHQKWCQRHCMPCRWQIHRHQARHNYTDSTEYHFHWHISSPLSTKLHMTFSSVHSLNTGSHCVIFNDCNLKCYFAFFPAYYVYDFDFNNSNYNVTSAMCHVTLWSYMACEFP